MRFSFSKLGAVCVLGGFEVALASQAPLARFEFTQVHMGTQFRIVLYAPDATSASNAANAAFARITELDNIMSDYNPGSELMALCKQAGGPPSRVSEDLFRVMSAAQELAKRSDGAFDITVGPIVRLWRRARRRHELPDPERLKEALELVGYERILLDADARTAQLLKLGMLLDLGGIAKGYAADQALKVLKRYGIASALVAAAGDIAVGDAPPRKSGWRIAIAPLEAPDLAEDAPSTQHPKTKLLNQPRYVTLHNAGVSTSGDAEQHMEIGGVRYSHIVNPKTGQALTGRSSVTVVAPNDTIADGLATATCVLGPQRGLRLVDSTEGAGVLFIQATATGIQYFETRFPR